MDILKMLSSATEIEIPKEIPCGDMPGDKINVVDGLIKQARVLLPPLANELDLTINNSPCERAVVAIAGGSGVGKTGISSVLAYVLNSLGLPCYIMSGDNYPHRIPFENDSERLRIFRQGGIKALRDDNLLTPEVVEVIRKLQKEEKDSDPSLSSEYSWFETYRSGGAEALAEYLGTPFEQDYKEVNQILASFKRGDNTVWMKRMGRDNTALWYDKIDMKDKKVLILEWTHATNEAVTEADIPILLKSTPEETLQYRLFRARDAGADSPFTTMVLGIEQKLLDSSAKRAKIILTKSGNLISYEDYDKPL